MAFSKRVMTPADWAKLAPYFKPSEFKEPMKMGYEFMMWLLQVRKDAGVPMNPSSSYRSPAYNKSVGGATDSAHCDVPCDSVDIAMEPRPDDPNWNYSRFKIMKAALDNGCQRIGTYQNGSLHLDRTEHERPAPRMWRQVGAENK